MKEDENITSNFSNIPKNLKYAYKNDNFINNKKIQIKFNSPYFIQHAKSNNLELILNEKISIITDESMKNDFKYDRNSFNKSEKNLVDIKNNKADINDNSDNIEKNNSNTSKLFTQPIKVNYFLIISRKNPIK